MEQAFSLLLALSETVFCRINLPVTLPKSFLAN